MAQNITVVSLSDIAAGIANQQNPNFANPSLVGGMEVRSANQSLSGSGAVDIVTDETLITSTGANSLTMANGINGQLKTLTMVVHGGTATLTPTTPFGYSTIAFTAVGQSVTLKYNTTYGWIVKANFGATIS